MTESEVHALKVFVERAIRPVRAEACTKLRMREEFYAHACDVYESELGYGATPQIALEQTIARLGDPAGLTQDYQSAVPWHERLSYWIGTRYQRKVGESRVHFAVRTTIDYVILLGLLLGLALLLKIDQLTDWNNEGQVMLRMTVGLWVVCLINAFVFSLLGCAMRDQFSREPRLVPRAIRLLPSMVIAGLMVVVTGWGLTYAVSSDPAAAWRVLRFWIPLVILVPPGCVIVAWLTEIECRRVREWLSLDITD